MTGKREVTMKKKVLLVLASGLLALASCEGISSISEKLSSSAASSTAASSQGSSSSDKTSSSSSSEKESSSSSETPASSSSSTAPDSSSSAPVKNPSVTSVTVTGEGTIEIGGTTTLTASVIVVDDASQDVTWSSDTETVATVDNGVVTGVSAGTAVIKATSTFDNTKFGTLTITVNAKAEISLTLALRDGDKSDLTEGGGANLVTATLANAPTDAIISYAWATSSNAVAIGSAVAAGFKENSQWVTPSNYGSATVTCTATYNGKEYPASMDFTVAANYASYTMINTASEFLAMVETKGTITTKYALGSNIDLNGAILNGRGQNNADQGNVFSGTLDGCGYTVKNFTIKNESTYETDKATGIFWLFNGVLRDIHLIGTINSAGFSGLLAKEVNGGSIENCIFEATNTQKGSDWTFGRNGVIASCISGAATINNVITKLTAEDAMCFPFFAYSFNDAGTFKIQNGYTNIAHDTTNENFKPFNPNGGTITDTHVSNLNAVDFASCTKDSFKTLSDKFFIFADNKMPVLKHDTDAFDVLSPVVEFTSTKKTVKVGETITLTAEIKYGTGTIAFTSSDSTVATVDSATGVVTGVKEGTATITASVTIDSKEYKATVDITVKAAGQEEDVSTRFAVKLSSAVGGAWLKAHVTWAEGYTLTAADVDNTTAKIVTSTGSTLTSNGIVGETTTSATEIVMGLGFPSAEFVAAANHTFTINVTLNDVTCKLTEVFTGKADTTDAYFDVVSQSCTLAE